MGNSTAAAARRQRIDVIRNGAIVRWHLGPGARHLSLPDFQIGDVAELRRRLEREGRP